MQPPLPFPAAVTEIHGRDLPEKARPAGYAAIIAAYRLRVPLPRILCAIGSKHRLCESGGWRLFTPRHAPQASLEGQLTFALKYEGVDLAVLKTLFAVLDPAILESMIRARPTGRYVRRIWFLYEWLTGHHLDLPPLRRSSYVCAIDPAMQYPGSSMNSPRHRIRNNLPGSPAFCPLVFRSASLDAACNGKMRERAHEIAARASDLERSVLSHLLITAALSPEGQPALQAGLQHQWYDAFAKADDLSAAPIGDAEKKALSTISTACAHGDPVIASACVWFGATALAGMHENGAGLVLQHALLARGFAPPGLILPVSIVNMRHHQEYFSLIERVREYAAAGCGGLFDATNHAAYLHRCLTNLITTELPGALASAKHFNAFYRTLAPQFSLRLLTFLFDRMTGWEGKIPVRARRRCRLLSEQITLIESVYAGTAAQAA